MRVLPFVRPVAMLQRQLAVAAPIQELKPIPAWAYEVRAWFFVIYVLVAGLKILSLEYGVRFW